MPPSSRYISSKRWYVRKGLYGGKLRIEKNDVLK